MITTKEQMMTHTTHGKASDPTDLWYVPDPRIGTASAARMAASIADRLLTNQPLEAATEAHGLFAAMHTCAFHAAQCADNACHDDSDGAQWRRRWEALRAYLVQENMGLAYTVHHRFAVGPACHDKDDLLSEAMFGLIRAVRRFNPWKGFTFSTYAYSVITRALMRRKKRECRYHEHFPVSYDATVERPGRGDDLHTGLCLERLTSILGTNTLALTPLESDVLARRYPPDIRQRRSLKEIGRGYGFSKERIRQIEQRILAKLRRTLEQDPLLG